MRATHSSLNVTVVASRSAQLRSASDNSFCVWPSAFPCSRIVISVRSSVPYVIKGQSFEALNSLDCFKDSLLSAWSFSTACMRSLASISCEASSVSLSCRRSFACLAVWRNLRVRFSWWWIIETPTLCTFHLQFCNDLFHLRCSGHVAIAVN